MKLLQPLIFTPFAGWKLLQVIASALDGAHGDWEQNQALILLRGIATCRHVRSQDLRALMWIDLSSCMGDRMSQEFPFVILSRHDPTHIHTMVPRPAFIVLVHVP